MRYFHQNQIKSKFPPINPLTDHYQSLSLSICYNTYVFMMKPKLADIFLLDSCDTKVNNAQKMYDNK
jgi:hypothetical protein